MSQTNSFQPWKQTLPVGLPSNLGSAIFGGTTAVSAAAGYGKVPALLPPPQQPTPSPSSSSSSSSSSLSSVTSSTPATGALGTPGTPMHTPLLTVPSPGAGTVSSSTNTGTDFLAQIAVNKLKLGKLNASYELTAGTSPASHPPTSATDPDMDPNAEHDPSVVAMKAMLASSGCHGSTILGDREREQQIQQIFEKSISDTTKKQIVEILEKISTLRPPERLLLYLRMPGGYPETDPLRQSQNPLGTRLEINHTINWVRSHLEHDPNVSIPKQEVYDDYVAYCARINIKPLSTADFGKVMKQVFPGIRPRRLGTRGHSRYCYAAMRKATKLPIPKLPDLTSAGGSNEKPSNESQHFGEEESWKVVKAWAEAMLPSCFGTINELASFIAKNNLNTPSGIGSRQQLHKKILQREMKEKRKLSAVAMKKRRKKRRKTLSTSICDVPEPRNASTPDSNNKSKPIGAFGTVETQQRTVSTKQPPEVTSIDRGGGMGASCNGATAAQNNSAPRYDEQGNLILIETQDPTTQDEFIIPRERVISICNMDKNALDGYLNCEEENSQDQDQELLKYFPEEDGTSGVTQPQHMNPSLDNDGPPSASGGASSSFGSGLFDDDEKLFQIRMILEKNQSNQNKQQMLQQQQQMQQVLESHLAPYDSNGTINQNHQSGGMGLQPGSAAASLAALSQRHNTCPGDHPSTTGASSSTVLAPDQHQRQQQLKHSGSTQEGGMPVQSYGTTNQMNGTIASGGSQVPHSQTLQSPTARRKNFSFVPISEQPRASTGNKQLAGSGNINHTPTASPFVSPRSTPIHRKAHKASNGLTLNLAESKFNGQQTQPQHGHHQQQLPYGQHHQAPSQQRSYLSGYIKNELPASAPPSPSMMQPYRFGTMNGLNCGISAMPTTFQPICNPHGSLSSAGNGAGGTHNGPVSSLESRSSSVPLIPNYDPYCNSNYTSVSQTPVPSEYDDFTDTGNILDMLNEQSNQLTPAVKIEESELTMPDLLPDQLQQQQEDGGFFARSANYNIVSRSVPSTPLPHLGGFRPNSSTAGPGGCITPMSAGPGSNLGMVRSMFELPKSVPSTPIALNEGSCQGDSMFQYSPETSRDFLINGNSVDRSKSSAGSFYSPVAGASGSGGSAAGVSGTLVMASKGSDSISGGAGAGELVGTGSHPTGPCSVHSTSSAAADPIAPPSADLASVLSDGIEGLSNELDSMAESMINSDILRNL
uniref:RFX-type winged-helix domain-containing protein n=1 Tax=Anopheles culicifacies TaxID=139723 RepID=A0A182MFQ0_9DIPT